jgi:aspartate/methionine/tyrosine aminotransferase
MAREIAPSLLLRRHSELAELHHDGDNGRFLSGWQCANPWSNVLVERVRLLRSHIDSSEYHSLNDDTAVQEALLEFHRTVDRQQPQALFLGEGASSIIFSFCAWLKDAGVTDVFYIRPLYFALHFALRLFGIRARPVSARQAYEAEFTMNLPATTAILLVSDPVWYAGVPLPDKVVDKIVKWQRKTASWIFVDGSFQYMRWDGRPEEATARLDETRTIRVVCPTKALALHGYRFAYATVPASVYTKLVQLYTYIYGSDTAESIALARAAIAEVNDRTIIDSLARLAADRHGDLRRRGIINAAWNPCCGYFVFERINVPVRDEAILMDGSFFEQRRHCDARRVNLLSPSIHSLG